MGSRSMRGAMESLCDKTKKREEANRFMASKLMEMVENDKINSDYDRDFICSCMARINAGIPLSDNQEVYLEKCFHHKY